MKAQTFNRTEKKDEKITKQEKAYNFVQRMKRKAAVVAGPGKTITSGQ